MENASAAEANLRWLLRPMGVLLADPAMTDLYTNGPGEGRAHIARLRELALRAGFDVPLYTVTAWDNTIYPARQVTPVFGSYPDAPWGTVLTVSTASN